MDQKFCEANPTMFKVSSLLHRHHTFVVDVGGPKKQLEWRDKLHAIIRRVLEQTKKGRLQQVNKSPVHQVQYSGRRAGSYSILIVL